ncbi:GtrA family protein [Microbacterium oleivorans]|uniref:GtrA family protein n=1 Tax=Microbacterium oleivorans TaxID=273677 RepID=UPI002041D7EE|nr:bifunctional glycosyltransferase family 2/GtrA family protein [Microbacterium oleivorans]MCM3695286.1 bifunctional glycosyltransferase family 2/GtrA family protein [Microbacterium oleivorans]
MIILIPAYEPGATLTDLVGELTTSAPGISIVVVDDGSGPHHAAVFDDVAALGATVLGHVRNRGKGAALRTGFQHAMTAFPGRAVITADADGQHVVRDILNVGAATVAAMDAGTPAMVLGCRDTGRRGNPTRSRLGNGAARVTFRLAAGWSLSDTQTGLRGIPPVMLPWMLDQRGDRFEYEQNVLLRCHRDGWAASEVPIETVYLAGNTSSHFRPLTDTLRVGLPLALFAASSLLAFAVDTLLLFVLTASTGALIPSIVASRLVSATVNFVVNRHVVFRRDGAGALRREATRYALLAGALLASNVAWMTMLTAAGLPLLAAKLLTEAALFALGYLIQRSVVFGRTPRAPRLESAVNAALRNGEGAVAQMDIVTTHPRRNP